MSRNGVLWRRWRRIFRRDPGPEVEEELRYHIEERIRDYIDRGMDPEAARRAAMERLGDLERVREECTGLLAAERRASISSRSRWSRVFVVTTLGPDSGRR